MKCVLGMAVVIVASLLSLPTLTESLIGTIVNSSQRPWCIGKAESLCELWPKISTKTTLGHVTNSPSTFPVGLARGT